MALESDKSCIVSGVFIARIKLYSLIPGRHVSLYTEPFFEKLLMSVISLLRRSHDIFLIEDLLCSPRNW